MKKKPTNKQFEIWPNIGLFNVCLKNPPYAYYHFVFKIMVDNKNQKNRLYIASRWVSVRFILLSLGIPT